MLERRDLGVVAADVAGEVLELAPMIDREDCQFVILAGTSRRRPVDMLQRRILAQAKRQVIAGKE